MVILQINMYFIYLANRYFPINMQKKVSWDPSQKQIIRNTFDQQFS